jgi:prevent-host-death family protein
LPQIISPLQAAEIRHSLNSTVSACGKLVANPGDILRSVVPPRTGRGPSGHVRAEPVDCRYRWLKFMSNLSIVAKICWKAHCMKSMSAKDAKNEFGRLIDTARAEPVTIEKHGRPVVVVLSVEEYRRIARDPAPARAAAPRRKKE